MRRFPLPSRAVCLAVIAALAASSFGFGVSAAQRAGGPIISAPPVDPVSAAVSEASRRFGVPEHWIRSVMRVESAGNAGAVSSAGAIGLMQVMPATYAELRVRYGLGPNPFDIRDNVLAGTAYLREMHDRYGVQGMLAAYNAGPGRWEAYVRAGRRLPGETVNYLAQLAPAVGATAVLTPLPAPNGRASDALRPTLFVQVGGVSAAAGMQSEGATPKAPTMTQAVPDGQPDSLFIQRPWVDRARPADATSATDRVAPVPAPAPANPLFVPVRTAAGRT